MNLANAIVVGYFSLPAPSLAEANPTAYNLAMAEAPAGAGSCAHCGMGILHHVVVETEGVRAFIGTTCALKVGEEPVRRCVREGKTSDQIAALDAKRETERLAFAASVKAEEARVAKRSEEFADLLKILRTQGSDFCSSLADQLARGPLSERQAYCGAKAVFGRETKKNTGQWNAFFYRCRGATLTPEGWDL